MVNYDTQDGYSVSSFQSTSPQQLLKISSSSHHHSNNPQQLDMPLPGEATVAAIATNDNEQHSHHPHHQQQHEEMPAAAALLPATTLGSNGLTLQSHLLVPSTSILTIREVHFKHAGNYTCAPSNARAGTITIHVLRGTYCTSYTVVFLCFT